MAEENINSYVDFDALEAEQKRLEKLVNDTVELIKSKRDELRNTEFKLFDTSTAGEANKAQKEAKKNIDELTLATKEYKKTVDQLAVTEAKLAVAESESAKQLAFRKKELQEANKLNRDGASAYNDLQKSLAEAARLYKDLAAAKGLDNAQTIAAQKRAKDLNDQLKAIDSGMGNYQRNVGNYSSAVNGLQFSFRNIAGELPNLGISLRTFGMAISNNITPLVDNIAALKKENVALVAAGKPTISLGKQIASSFLSWNTAVSLLIVGGLQLIEYFSKASKAQEELSESAKEAAEAQQRVADSIGQEVSALKTLYLTATNTQLAYKERGKAVDELQRLYPDYLANLNREKILNGEVSASIDLVTKSIIERAKMTARTEQLTKAISDLALVELELEKLNSKDKNTFVFYTPEQKAALESRKKSLETQIQTIEKGIQSTNRFGADDAFWLDANAKKQYEANKAKEKALALMTEEERKAAQRAAKEETKSSGNKTISSDTSEDVVRQVMDWIKTIEVELIQTRDNNLRNLLQSLQKNEITIKEYEEQKKVIVTKSEDDILQEQLKYLSYRLDAVGLNADNQQKVMEKYTELYKKEIKKRYDSEEAEALISAKNLQEHRDNFDKRNEQSRKDKLARDKETERAQNELNRRTISAALELSDTIANAFKNAYESQIQGLQGVSDEIDKNKQKEIDAINATTLSEQEKQRRIKEAEAKSAAEKEKNERKIADLKTKQARLDKATSLAQIAFNTAMAISSVLSTGGGTRYADFGISAATLTALVASIGAIQAATVLATPIPKYEEGTLDHKGGLAILGDGKEKELVIEPNKKPYWSADSDTLYNLPKHTMVVPESKLSNTLGKELSNKEIVNAVLNMTGHLGGGLKQIEKTIKKKDSIVLSGKNRRWESYYFENSTK